MKIFLTLVSILTFSAVFAQKPLQHKINFGMNYVIGDPDFLFNNSYYDKIDDDYISLKFDYIASFRLNDYLSIGPGVGIRHLISLGDVTNYEDFNDNDLAASYLALPVFLNVNVRFLNKKVSPFLSLSTGYSFSITENELTQDDYAYNSKLKSGFIANANTGVNFRFRNGMNLSAGPYFEFQPTTKVHSEMSYFGNSQTNVSQTSIDYKLYHVGLQVAFAF